MIQILDIAILLIFIPVQWHLTTLWLRLVRERCSARTAVALRRGIVLFNAVVMLGWLLDFANAVGMHVPGMVFFALRTAVLAYGITATAVTVLRLILRFAIGKLSGGEFDPERRRLLYTAGNVMAAAPFAALSYGALIGRLDFQVREVDVPVAGLPQELDGLRLLHLSDIHLSAFLSEEQLARVIDASNELRPQLTLVTGDLISAHGDPIDACLRQIARLKSDAGVLACMGNHERFAEIEDYTAVAAARVGIRFLRMESQTVRFGGGRLNIAGVDYQPLFQKASYLRGAERLVVPGEVNVLLSHNPDVFPVAARQGYNLMLAGHTHGGQVSVEILDQAINPARFLTPYVYGLYRQAAASAYVTRGIGTIGIPARIGAPPEISLLRLRKA